MKRFMIATTVCLGWSVLAQSQPNMWVTAYYAGWTQGNQWSYHMRPQDIDFSAVTHVIHFALTPNADGTVDDQGNGVTEENAAALVPRAHAAGVKVLISLGGWNSEAGFAGATRRENLKTFIDNLLTLVRKRGYDGIDLDWEPISSQYVGQYEDLVRQLSSRLKQLNPPLLLTAATGSEGYTFGRLASYFDQINLMTYDMSGAWPGWVTWHNAPIYDGGSTFPGNGKPLPSTDERVKQFISAGVPREKLGIGIDFYGYVWNGGSGTRTGGVTAPRQSWRTAPWVKDNVPYYEIMDKHYQPQYYRWDDGARAAYLSIDKPGSDDDKFISYDDSRSCEQKIRYVAEQKLGGVIIWELGGGWRPGVMIPDQLLKSVKAAKKDVKR